MIDCTSYATGVTEQDPGLWAAKSSEKISYPDHGNDACFQLEERSFWFNHRNRCIVAVVRRHPPGGPIFDIGGGNGFVARSLVDAGFPTVVVEPGMTGARHALARGLAPVIASTFDEAEFVEHGLPAVGLFDVVEHIEDALTFLQRVHTCMAIGGRLYVTVPAYRALWSSEDDAAGHFERYTLASLTRVLEGAGFAVDFATYMFAWLPLPVFLLRALPSRLGLRRAEESAERVGGEHGLPRGITGRVMGAMLRAEERRIAAGTSVPFGGSCLAVARVV